jgi:uncharacterized protein (TIGR03435 family)
MRILLALVPVLAAVTLSAQAPPGPPPPPPTVPAMFNEAPTPSWDAPHLSFEVASVKANKSGAMTMSIRTLPTSFNSTNLPLRTVIMQAYRLSAYQLVGAPGWLDSERFDIVAKAPEGSRPEQAMLMLRGLLAERFKLKVHGETRDTQIYALMLARNDGKLGPKLSKSTDDCEKILAERRAQARAGGPPNFQLPGPNEKPVCTFSTRPVPVPNGRPLMSFNAGGQSLDLLVSRISGMLNKRVIDGTGLTGLYDYQLQFSMLSTAPIAGLTTAPPGNATPAAPIDDGPTIFDAVRELGLKLELERGPVEHLVIDSVERPTED